MCFPFSLPGLPHLLIALPLPTCLSFSSCLASPPTSHIYAFLNLQCLPPPGSTLCHLLSLGLSLSLPPPTECQPLAAWFRHLVCFHSLRAIWKVTLRAPGGLWGAASATIPLSPGSCHKLLLLEGQTARELSHGVGIEGRGHDLPPQWSGRAHLQGERKRQQRNDLLREALGERRPRNMCCIWSHNATSRPSI